MSSIKIPPPCIRCTLISLFGLTDNLCGRNFSLQSTVSSDHIHSSTCFNTTSTPWLFWSCSNKRPNDTEPAKGRIIGIISVSPLQEKGASMKCFPSLIFVIRFPTRLFIILCLDLLQIFNGFYLPLTPCIPVSDCPPDTLCSALFDPCHVCVGFDTECHWNLYF